MDRITSPLDLSKLLDNPGVCVHCSLLEDAKQFVDCLQHEIPSLTLTWEDGVYNFNSYKENTVYTIWSKSCGVWSKSRLMYGGMNGCLEMGYTVIEFDELVGQIQESDEDLSLLFGGSACM